MKNINKRHAFTEVPDNTFFIGSKFSANLSSPSHAIDIEDGRINNKENTQELILYLRRSDIKPWIVGVILSCETQEQIRSCINLIRNYYKNNKVDNIDSLCEIILYKSFHLSGKLK